MSEYTVFLLNKSIGPAFNEAAAILKENKDIKLLEKLPIIGMFVIEAAEATLSNLKKSLPGWDILKIDDEFTTQKKPSL